VQPVRPSPSTSASSTVAPQTTFVNPLSDSDSEDDD
jgi:hypothetical protein